MDNKYKGIPFWSWNDELDETELINQIQWMHDKGIGGFFMHARGGLTTPYLGEKWFSCIEACLKKAKELNMEAYAYDENGWPSGFVGGKLLEDAENRDRYLTYSFGPYDENSLVSYDISSDKLVRTKCGENCLNIFEHIATSTADVLNKDVVRKFINLTHEEYKKHDKYGNLRGFFTDEPQYYRWGNPYTKVLPEYFKDKYNEDILDRLGLLFVEKEGYRDFRYKFWKSMQELMLDAFAKQVYTWCDENGYNLTGHYVEETSIGNQLMCCGGIMPFYEYEHIPGVDWLCRMIGNDLSPKQVSSVAAQLGKKQVLTECYAMVGWDATPIDLKHIAEYLYVNGVNLMCHHLLPYSEHGQRKRDYPEHYSKINPWVDVSFNEFNDYFTELGKKLSNSTEVVDVAVFHPLRSAYFDYKRELQSTGFGISPIDIGLADLIKTLNHKQINYHLIDETILAKYGSIKNGELIVGNCSYKYIVFPKIYTMDKTSDSLLKKYAKQNGKILFTDEKPSYLEGNSHSYDYLFSNTSLDEIKNNQIIIPKDNEYIHHTLRKDEKGKYFIYAVNLGEDTDWIIENKKLKQGAVVFGNSIHFDKYESKILEFAEDQPSRIVKKNSLYLKDKFVVNGTPKNYLTLDFLSYSKDGISYSEPLHYMGIFFTLLEERYEGDLFLKYSFNVKDIPSNCLALIEDTNTKEVYINGNLINKCGITLEKDLWNFNIAKYIKEGNNEIVVKIKYHQDDIVYYALFGENVTESLKNCLVYNTTIEAIYLQGDFAVYGDFVPGKQSSETMIGENFYLGKQKHEISSLITDGFPFFRGNISLSKKIYINDTNYELVLDKRFQYVFVTVNGKKVGSMMFSNKIDLSDYLKIGENEIILDLIVSNRNLLGPSHGCAEEDISVGPHSYERKGTWKNGKSSILRETYSFVKTII